MFKLHVHMVWINLDETPFQVTWQNIILLYVNQQKGTQKNPQKYPVQSHAGQKKTPHHKAKGY